MARVFCLGIGADLWRRGIWAWFVRIQPSAWKARMRMCGWLERPGPLPMGPMSTQHSLFCPGPLMPPTILATNHLPSWRQTVLTFSDLPMKTSNLSTRLPKAARPCSTWRAVDRMGKERPSGQMSLRGTSARSRAPGARTPPRRRRGRTPAVCRRSPPGPCLCTKPGSGLRSSRTPRRDGRSCTRRRDGRSWSRRDGSRSDTGRGG